MEKRTSAAARVHQDYVELLDAIGDDMLAEIDREEAYRGEDQDDCFTFHGLTRDEQADILEVLDTNLERTVNVNYRGSSSSYTLKHDVERALGVYTSNLQTKVAMRVLGFKRSKCCTWPNPVYNATARSCRKFHEENRSKPVRGRVRMTATPER